MRWLCTALVLMAAVPAFAADDDEAPPRLSPAESRDRDLLRQSHREAAAAVSLLSTGGMLELQGLASFLTVMLCCHLDGPGNGANGVMLQAAFPTAIASGIVGNVALAVGFVLISRAGIHKRRANPYLSLAGPLTVQF